MHCGVICCELSLLGVTIGIFSIIAVLAAVDSLDRRFKCLDKKYYLFNEILLGLDIPKWKREQFPILSMMNTPT
jgi:putative ABC transport system permease protein